jgi:Zn ribbon nucleic-acid-binding protein
MVASATTTAGGGVALQFPYREALVDELKEQIPPRFRRWDRDAKCWLVLGAYAPAAVHLLLEHFPRAAVPDDAPRRLPSSPARTEKPFPVPPLVVEASTAPDDPARDRLVASVRCPTCHERHDQPVRVVAETSLTVATRETITPELVSVCPACNTLAVVAFHPAAAQAAP